MEQCFVGWLLVFNFLWLFSIFFKKNELLILCLLLYAHTLYEKVMVSLPLYVFDVQQRFCVYFFISIRCIKELWSHCQLLSLMFEESCVRGKTQLTPPLVKHKSTNSALVGIENVPFQNDDTKVKNIVWQSKFDD